MTIVLSSINKLDKFLFKILITSLFFSTKVTFVAPREIHSKPKDIPVVPNLAYKSNGWINFKDWLGY